MKKVLFCLIVFMIGIFNVYALDMEVTSVIVKEKSDDVEVSTPTISGTNVNSNIVFKNVRDSLTLEIKLKNNEENDISIKEVSDNNDNEYITTTYTYDGLTVLMTITYEKKLVGNLDLDDIEISVLFNNGEQTTINPQTSDNIMTHISLLMLSIVGILLGIKYKKKAISMLGVLFMIVPITLMAEEELKINITISTENISIFKPITYINRQVENEINIGDEVAIGSEHFYIISNDNNKIGLLSKYNLYVGDIFNVDTSNGEYTLDETISTNDTKYGLQNSLARGWIEGEEKYYGVVPFSGTNYWDNSVCQFTGTSYNCAGEQGLSSGYTGNYNNDDSYPYVYKSNLSTTSPEIIYENGWEAVQNNGYTIAYYVEEYVYKLKTLGAPDTIEGRLLSYEEMYDLYYNTVTYDVDLDTCIVGGTQLAINEFGFNQSMAGIAAQMICNGQQVNGGTLSSMISAGYISSEYYEALGLSNVKGKTNIASTSYWLGSSYNSEYVLEVASDGTFGDCGFSNDDQFGVRPVIVISSSDIE